MYINVTHTDDNIWKNQPQLITCVTYGSVADLGATSQSKFFIFMQFSAQIISNNRLALPGVGAPSLSGYDSTRSH